MEVDKKFGEAIDLLSAFENDFPSKYSTSDPGIGGTAAREATMSDTSGSPLAVLCALKERIHAKVKLPFVSLPLNADEFSQQTIKGRE